MELPVAADPRNENYPSRTMFARLKNLLGLPSAGDDSGARGEAAAADFLRQRLGYAIVGRNWRNLRDRREEIDLVARDGEVLVFVEVKTRAPWRARLGLPCRQQP